MFGFWKVIDLEMCGPGLQGKLVQLILALRIYVDETIVFIVVSRNDAAGEITKVFKLFVVKSFAKYVEDIKVFQISAM